MSSELPQQSSRTLIDSKFVAAASLLGLPYAGIIVVMARLVGKEAEGVASVALTALATARFPDSTPDDDEDLLAAIC